MAAPAVCVIFNPTAGRRRAARYLAGFRRQFPAGFELRPTSHPNHAEELALEAARAGFDIVAAAGGDGTVHEVANGILRSGRTDVLFHVLPVGSANDYAYALARSGRAGGVSRPVADQTLDLILDQDATRSPVVHHVDVGLARRDDGRERWFVNGLGLGFNGAVALEAERIRWLRGLPLYTLALLRALWRRYECPEMTVTFDGQPRRTPTLALSVNLGRREGSFQLTPHAELDDGLFDYLHAGPLSRWQLLRYLPRMVTGRLPTDDPLVRLGRCREASVQGESPLIAHLDGEFFCRPEENVRRIDVRLLPKRLAVLMPLAA